MLQRTTESASAPLPHDGYAIARRADSDYAMALVRCPTSHRLYRATRILQVGDGAAWVGCGECDKHGHTRGDRAYSETDRQPHCYELIGGDDG